MFMVRRGTRLVAAWL
ncbi:hypothetical protein Taro_043609 [Colocasia esculenta]|uniref:Uncharacterized protein n=1 Tax=Colocasia esculenta TaxID=4460 RepID=A0A843WZ77_COLES|nr:hypothetical protein [Colocasia esculenta]